MTREEWLTDGLTHLEKYVKDCGIDIKPPKIRVSCGWPSIGGLRKNGGVAAECHKRESSKDGVNEIFISPLIEDPVIALADALHEYIHALDNCESKHRGFFAKTARKVGFEGSLRATIPSEAMTASLKGIAEKLGPYPHKQLNPGRKDKKQTTRLLKAECPCGYIIRLTRQWAEKGLPMCVCGEGFVLDEKCETGGDLSEESPEE